MKYGCCLNMIASKSDKTGIEHLRRLAMSGYDYVELPLAEIMDLSESWTMLTVLLIAPKA